MGVYKRDMERDFEDHENVDGETSRGAVLGDHSGRRAGAGDRGESAARDRDETSGREGNK